MIASNCTLLLLFLPNTIFKWKFKCLRDINGSEFHFYSQLKSHKSQEVCLKRGDLSFDSVFVAAALKVKMQSKVCSTSSNKIVFVALAKSLTYAFATHYMQTKP